MSERKHNVPRELLDSLLANYKTPEDLISDQGLLKQLTKLLVEKALDVEMTEHLDHDRHSAVGNESGNTRNGRSRKTLKGEFGHLPIEVPRDRHGSFEPKLIPMHKRATALQVVVKTDVVRKSLIVRHAVRFRPWGTRTSSASIRRCPQSQQKSSQLSPAMPLTRRSCRALPRTRQRYMRPATTVRGVDRLRACTYRSL